MSSTMMLKHIADTRGDETCRAIGERIENIPELSIFFLAHDFGQGSHVRSQVNPDINSPGEGFVGDGNDGNPPDIPQVFVAADRISGIGDFLLGGQG